MKKFSIRESLKRGWEIFKANKKLLILSTLIMILIGFVPKGNHYHHMEMFVFTIGLIFVVVGVILKIGFYKILLKLEDGRGAKLGDILGYENLFFKYLITQILFGLLVGVGLILFIIPGLYFALTYLFAPIISIDTKLSIRDSFKESKKITEGSKLKLLLFIIVLVGVNMLGAMALMVGLLVSIPVSMLAFVHVYRTLMKSKAVEVSTSTL